MHSDLTHLRPGGDPRTLSDFAALRDELNKRFHPARPDVDWARAHGLCLSLFQQHGSDLQTIAWFTLIRQHQAGMNGLNEGLTLLQQTLSQHWQALWPQQMHARVEILSTLSQQLISGLRGQAPVYADLAALYQAESTLTKIGQQLQTLELKHLTQLERLQTLLTTQARQLENTDQPENRFSPTMPAPVTASPQIATPLPEPTFHERTAVTPTVSINAKATLTSPSSSVDSTPSQPSFRRGIGLGVLIGVVLSGLAGAITVSVWSPWKPVSSLAQTLPQLPTFDSQTETLLEQQLHLDSKDNKGNSYELPAEPLAAIEQTLKELASLSPIWAQQYGNHMVNYLIQSQNAQPELTQLRDQWEKNLTTNALPESRLKGWSEGMVQLNSLSQRLDSLDGKPRSYITGSELKTIIFSAREHFNQAVPLEEELRRLEALQKEGTVPDAEYQRLDNHFKQLLNRYALLQQHSLK